MRQRIIPSRETLIRLFKSLAVGVATFLVQLSVLWLLTRFLRPMTAFSWAYGVGVATHYTLNRFWALRSARRDSGRQFLEYAGAVMIGYLIQNLTFRVCLNVVGMGILWSQVFAVPPSTLVVFLIMHYHVFRRHA